MLTWFALLVGSVVAMEAVAIVVHKYVMHGPMWFLHKSHHQRREGWFELNDLFAVFFAIPPVALIYFGSRGYPWLLPIGLGMTAYGLIYFGFHDVLVHRRLPHRLRPKSSYLKRIIKAHHVHHATRDKDGAVSFGFIYAPPIEKLVAQREASS
ncbi:MAG: sterol desaturase family protein [Holophagae bacterium]|jgi:beta-carotene 3-hydroxylase